ncbi:MAG: hypothetical protein MUC78_13295 [Bacteroidales bacterium]|jgi:hypothetical protein|nr:hypothetical protein [Bacteroidales bacterium]
MDYFRILKRGAVAAATSYRLILVMWLTALMMVLLVALPLKSILKGVFDRSLATERMLDGFDAGLAGDMGQSFGYLIGAASFGGLLLILAGFLLFTFFAGGLFTRFTIAWGDLNVASFMKASARNFLPFLMLALLMTLIIFAWTALIIGVPVGIVAAVTEGSIMGSRLMLIPFIIWALGMPVWLLVTDHSRRWMAATGSGKIFRAMGAGFKALRRGFLRSYSTMVTLFIVNVLFFGAALWIATFSVPERGGLIFLFFLATQALFILRLFLKAWRYATVSELALIQA